MTNMKHLFVSNPIKTEVVSDVRIEGTFACQRIGCDGDAEYADQIEDRLVWTCDTCGHKGSMRSFV